MTNYLENLFTDEELKILRDQFYVGCAQKTGTPAAWGKVTVGRRDRCEHPFIKKRALWRSLFN